MNKSKTLGLAAALVIGAGTLGLPTVSRASVVTTVASETLYFTSDHCTGTCGTSPFAKAVVDQLSDGNLKFTVTLVNATGIVSTGFPLTFGFNLIGGPQITYSGLTTGFTIPDVLPVLKQNAGAGFTTEHGSDNYHMDGTGYFMYGVDWSGGSSTPFTGTLSFTVDATANLTLASLIKNGEGQYLVLDILGSNGKTGPVDASSVVPLPPAALLFGTALLGMGVLGRRRRKKDQLATAA